MESRKEKIFAPQYAMCNCAQKVLCAFSDKTGLDDALAQRIAMGLGSGMGCMQGTCGALIGVGIVLGFVSKDKLEARQRMAALMEAFQQRNGATLCKDLKGVETKAPLRSCPDCISDAIELLETELTK